MNESKTLKTEEIDSLINSNKVRLLIPHFRVRLMASIILEALYKEKGLDPKELEVGENDITIPDLPEDEKVDLCWQLILDGDMAGAMKAAKDATLHFPDSAEAWFISGVIRREIKDYSGAEEDYKKAVKLSPSDSVYHCELGTLYEDRGEFQKALNCYERASLLSPQTMVYRFCIGVAHSRLGELDEALKHLEGAMEGGGDSMKPLNFWLAGFYNDYAIADWIKTEKGLFCVSEKSADRSIHFLDKSLALAHSNSNLTELIQKNKQAAMWSKSKHWGLSIWETIKGGFGAVIFACIVSAIVDLSTASEVWCFLSFFLILGLWTIGNFKNGWKISSDMIVKLQQA